MDQGGRDRARPPTPPDGDPKATSLWFGRPATDVLAGLTFVLLGLGFALGALAYPVGTAARMGPGFFPLVLGSLLVVFGGLIVLKPALDGDGEPLHAPSWRAVALISLAILVFGLTIRGLGLLPTLIVTAFVAALASRETRVPGAAALAVGLTVVSVLIFVVALRLNLPLVGPWIPRF